MMLKLVLLISSLFNLSYALTYNNCPSNVAGRTELDNVCPRLEGIHPEGCCPQIFKNPPLTCNYHVVLNRGQAFLANSSYLSCQNGVTVSNSCCVMRYRACFVEPITKSYRPRLLYRQNTCCFESVCPPASYWRNPPNPDPAFKP